VFRGRPLDDDEARRCDREEFGNAFAQLVRSNGFAVCFEGVDGLRGDVIVDLKVLDRVRVELWIRIEQNKDDT